MSESTPSARSSAPFAAAQVTGGSAAQKAKQRQLALLAALAVVLGGLVVFVVLPAVSGGGAAPPPAPAARPGAPGATRTDATRRDVVDVHLERLEVASTDPSDGGRNPFRMGPAPPPAGAAAAHQAAPPTPAQPIVPTGPPPPPPVPPIPYKFIGIVTGGGRTGKIAVLSDGRNVVSGKEGDTVEGRYRIVKIGEESIQMEYVDGRGRQTIRLSGQ